MRRGRVGRPVRHDHNYNYRKVPLNYAIHPAFLAWVSGAWIASCRSASIPSPQSVKDTDMEHDSMPKLVSTQVDVLPTDM